MAAFVRRCALVLLALAVLPVQALTKTTHSCFREHTAGRGSGRPLPQVRV